MVPSPAVPSQGLVTLTARPVEVLTSTSASPALTGLPEDPLWSLTWRPTPATALLGPSWMLLRRPVSHVEPYAGPATREETINAQHASIPAHKLSLQPEVYPQARAPIATRLARLASSSKTQTAASPARILGREAPSVSLTESAGAREGLTSSEK